MPDNPSGGGGGGNPGGTPSSPSSPSSPSTPASTTTPKPSYASSNYDSPYDDWENFFVYNTGRNVSPNFNFMLRVEGLFDLPCRRVHSFTKANEYEYIQEGGLNDYVHMRRKPVSQPFTFQVERYVGVDYLDPLQPGTDLILPVVLFVCRMEMHKNFMPFRTYTFTGCTVMSKEYGELNAESSGLHTETTTIGYREMIRVTLPDGILEGIANAGHKFDFELAKDKDGNVTGLKPKGKHSAARHPKNDSDRATKYLWTGTDITTDGTKKTVTASDGTSIEYTHRKSAKPQTGVKSKATMIQNAVLWKYKASNGKGNTTQKRALYPDTDSPEATDRQNWANRNKQRAPQRLYRGNKNVQTGSDGKQYILDSANNKLYTVQSAKPQASNTKSKAAQIAGAVIWKIKDSDGKATTKQLRALYPDTENPEATDRENWANRNAKRTPQRLYRGNKDIQTDEKGQEYIAGPNEGEKLASTKSAKPTPGKVNTKAEMEAAKVLWAGIKAGAKPSSTPLRANYPDTAADEVTDREKMATRNRERAEQRLYRGNKDIQTDEKGQEYIAGPNEGEKLVSTKSSKQPVQGSVKTKAEMIAGAVLWNIKGSDGKGTTTPLRANYPDTDADEKMDRNAMATRNRARAPQRLYRGNKDIQTDENGQEYIAGPNEGEKLASTKSAKQPVKGPAKTTVLWDGNEPMRTVPPRNKPKTKEELTDSAVLWDGIKAGKDPSTDNKRANQNAKIKAKNKERTEQVKWDGFKDKKNPSTENTRANQTEAAKAKNKERTEQVLWEGIKPGSKPSIENKRAKVSGIDLKRAEKVLWAGVEPGAKPQTLRAFMAKALK
ncbi:MAG: hypothetical protein K6E19_02155 [Lachnospiraceae bacterium]|nr:hypothetical protein [Lachnospiraceae bacterium]